MSAREKRQNMLDREKTTSDKRSSEPETKGARISIIVTSLTIISLFFYFVLRDNSLPGDELSTIYVTLKDTPKYDEYKIKTTTYRDIILTTIEYEREFRITAKTYEATDHSAVKTNIFAGDRVELNVKKSALAELDNNTFLNNYNDVYGLSKNGRNYVDLELRTELADKDSKWSLFLLIIGMVMLPYGFIKNKPAISMNKAIAAAALIGLFITLIVSRL